MRRKYICTNGVVEVTQFVVGDKQTGGRKWYHAKNQMDKRDENARQAVRVAARILNCNYGPEDQMLTLTYSDEAYERLFAGLEPDEVLEKAKKTLGTTLEQARRQMRKATPPALRATTPCTGEVMRTFSVTADMDGETGEVVRVHHHVVITTAAAETLVRKWNHGLVHTEKLYKQEDYTPLGVYLLAQVRHREGKKKYSCSRNMVKPRVEEQVLDAPTENEIRVQPGAKVLDRTPYRDGMLSQYVRYKRKPKQPKKGGHKQRDTGGTNACGGTDTKGGSGVDFQKITWG